MQATEEAVYLFCLGLEGRVRDFDGPGLTPDSSVLLWPFEGLVAVVSRVKLADFTGPEGEAHLQDLSWVGPRAVRHEAVIEAVMGQSPVFPARFGTLFSSRESLAGRLLDHKETLMAFLDFMHDKEEWGVKGLLDRDKARKALGPEKGDSASTPLSPGKAYLLNRQHRTRTDRAIVPRVQALGDLVAEDLGALAEDTRPLKALTGSEDEQILAFNRAFLLRRDGLDAFHRRLDDLQVEYAEVGLVLAPSGPWPPYSFCPAIDVAEAVEQDR